MKHKKHNFKYCLRCGKKLEYGISKAIGLCSQCYLWYKANQSKNTTNDGLWIEKVIRDIETRDIIKEVWELANFGLI